MQFTDPYQPERDKLTSRAYDTHALQPVQDWDIIVDWLHYPQLLLDLAIQDNCPTPDARQNPLIRWHEQAIRWLPLTMFISWSSPEEGKKSHEHFSMSKDNSPSTIISGKIAKARSGGIVITQPLFSPETICADVYFILT